ncbi:hypothetical protein BJV77DRAFT_1094845 [Russula vinacea]|nr:hypothetical protein BJV77DRAFT_1094845 [Russula vinacea]
MKRTSAGSARQACYISVHNVPFSALRRMALQSVKHVAWLAYQLELKETQQHLTTRSTTPVPRCPFLGRTYHDSGYKTTVKNRKEKTRPAATGSTLTASAAAAVHTVLHLSTAHQANPCAVSGLTPEHLRNHESPNPRAAACGAKGFYNDSETPPSGVRFNQGGVLECWNSGVATQRLAFRASSNVIRLPRPPTKFRVRPYSDTN